MRLYERENNQMCGLSPTIMHYELRIMNILMIYPRKIEKNIGSRLGTLGRLAFPASPVWIFNFEPYYAVIL